MDRETMIYFSNLMTVTSRIVTEKQVYDEPWDRTNKDYLLNYIREMKKALSDHNYSALVQVGDKISSELKSIIQREYQIRVYYIDKDLRYLKNLNSCIQFTELDVMSDKAAKLKSEFPENEPITFLMRFNEVHQYYYFHGMIEEFVGALSSYIEFAKALGNDDAAKKLTSILNRCNSIGNRYVDENNLYYLTPLANDVIENMLKNF